MRISDWSSDVCSSDLANRAELEDAYQTIDVDKETIEAQLAELAILKSLRDDLVRKLQESEGSLAEQRELSDEAQLQVTLLNRQLAALREQLAQVSEALEISEAENKEQEVQRSEEHTSELQSLMRNS